MRDIQYFSEKTFLGVVHCLIWVKCFFSTIVSPPGVTTDKLGVLRNELLQVSSTIFTIIFFTILIKLGCLRVQSFSVCYVKVFFCMTDEIDSSFTARKE